MKNQNMIASVEKKDSKLMFRIIGLETIPRVPNLLPTAFKLGKDVWLSLNAHPCQ